jgi:8-oxo-dGTP diphosphatase
MITEKGYWIPDAVTADVAVLARTMTSVVVLLIQRSNNANAEPGKYALPGGHMDKTDHSLRETGARELQEETGLIIDKNDLHLIDIFDKPERDPRGRYIDAAYYTWVDISDIKKAKAADDAQAVTWWSLDDIEEADLAFDHKEILLTLKKIVRG